MRHRIRPVAAWIAFVCTLVLAMGACGAPGSDSKGATVSEQDVQEALRRGGTVTVWSWEPTLETVAADFEKKYPGVKVEIVNAGTNEDQYTALQNAVSAGKGVPDVAQIEYYALGQFALDESVDELSGYGANKFQNTFSAGPWKAVRQNGGIYALPLDSGPMALFYNKTVFDKHRIPVPRTWDEYVEAARALHRADPNVYITSDVGDAGATTSLIWQAGGRPYQVNGTNVRINFADQGSQRYARTWQQLIDEGLVADIEGWTEEWYKGLGDGTIATLPTGAWMTANLASSVQAAAGDWRVAPLPQWTEGETVSAENGGSSLAIPKDAPNKELAYAFVKYATTQEGVRSRIAEGAFPATRADLESEEFKQTPIPYLGGQQANQIFAEASRNVGRDWSYLPFQAYANSVFNDTVGKSYISGEPLRETLLAWQRECVKYGNDQGFQINK